MKKYFGNIINFEAKTVVHKLGCMIALADKSYNKLIMNREN